MTKKTTPPKIVQSAENYLLTNTVTQLRQGLNGLAHLMAANLPAAGESISKIMGEFDQRMNAMENEGRLMILQGYGPRAVVEMNKAKSAEEQEEVLKRAAVPPAKDPMTLKQFEDFLIKAFGVRDPGAPDSETSLIVPTPDSHGSLVRIAKSGDMLDLGQTDSFVMVADQGQDAGRAFTLYMVVDANTRLIYTSGSSTQVVTRSPFEDVWVFHTSGDYVDSVAFEQQANAILMSLPISGVSKALNKDLAARMAAYLEGDLRNERLVVDEEAGTVTYRVSPALSIVYANGAVKAVSEREDVSWESLLPCVQFGIISAIRWATPEAPKSKSRQRTVR